MRFEKQVFVRLDGDAFICTTKWPLLSIIRRVVVGRAVPVATPRSMARESAQGALAQRGKRLDE